jgi:hypothetical protein
MMGGAARAGGDQGRAVAGEAGDAMDARGLQGLRQGQRRQDGGEPAGQPRRARPRGAEERGMVRTPAFASVSPLHRREPTGAFKRNQIDTLLQRVRRILYW